MDITRRIADQMAAMGRLGPPFASALERAGRIGVSSEFVRDGSSLLRQLSGDPDAGAPDCLRDAPKDLVSTEAFLDKWARFRDVSGYDEVLLGAEGIAQALTRFNDTIRGLSTGQRRAVEATAAAGHRIDRILAGDTLVLASMGVMLIGVVSVVSVTGTLSLLPLSLLGLVPLCWWREARLYGRHLTRALRAQAVAMWRSGTRVFLLGSIVLLVMPLVARQVLSLTVAEQLLSTAVACTTLAWVLRPPAVIVLASSRGAEGARGLARQVSRMGIRGLRVSYFLRKASSPSEDVAITLDQYFQETMENLRVQHDANWEAVVFPLLDVAPVILVDARQLSGPLLHELNRLNDSPHLAGKAFVLSDRFSELLLKELPRLSIRRVQEEKVVATVATAVMVAMRSRGTIPPRA